MWLCIHIHIYINAFTVGYIRYLKKDIFFYLRYNVILYKALLLIWKTGIILWWHT